MGGGSRSCAWDGTSDRRSLQDIYFGKSKDILNDLRSPVSLNEVAKQRDLQSEIAKKLGARRATQAQEE